MVLILKRIVLSSGIWWSGGLASTLIALDAECAASSPGATGAGKGVDAGVTGSSTVVYLDLIDKVLVSEVTVTCRVAIEFCDTLSPNEGESRGTDKYRGVDGVWTSSFAASV